MTDELTLKAWAINASRNPYDEHQKAHADATLKLIEERDSLRAALDVARSYAKLVKSVKDNPHTVGEEWEIKEEAFLDAVLE